MGQNMITSSTSSTGMLGYWYLSCSQRLDSNGKRILLTHSDSHSWVDPRRPGYSLVFTPSCYGCLLIPFLPNILSRCLWFQARTARWVPPNFLENLPRYKPPLGRRFPSHVWLQDTSMNHHSSLMWAMFIKHGWFSDIYIYISLNHVCIQ